MWHLILTSLRTAERQSGGLRSQGGKCISTGSLAAPTGLGTYPTVLHVHLPGVVLALLCAQPAHLNASLKSNPSHRRLELRLPGEDPPRRGAHVRAVEAHGDTAPHIVDLFLAEVGDGVGATRLVTVEARFNALHQG